MHIARPLKIFYCQVIVSLCTQISHIFFKKSNQFICTRITGLQKHIFGYKVTQKTHGHKHTARATIHLKLTGQTSAAVVVGDSGGLGGRTGQASIYGGPLN